MAEIALREVPLFSEMDDQEVAGIRRLMDEVKFTPGQVIIREGEIGDHFYVVTDGHAQVIIRDADGQEIVLQEVGPGGFFGELSMLTNEPRAVRIRALDHVTALALERDEFFLFLRANTHAAIDVLVELGGRLRENEQLFRSMASRNVNVIEEEQMTFGERVADRVADTIGSWPFIITQTLILVVWIVLNVTAWIKRWDPYPFILLNLMLSFQAAYSGPVIMMSQNRQSDKDRLAAEIDHQVNTKAELGIGLLMKRLDDIEQEMAGIRLESKASIGNTPRARKPNQKTVGKRKAAR